MQTKTPGKTPATRKGDQAIEWWFGTVFLAFFPLLLAVVISLVRSGSVDFNRIFGDGELILSAFLIAIPTLIKCSKNNRLLFFLLLFSCFFLLSAYVSIKTNTNNVPVVVYITSGICVGSSILVSYIGEKNADGEGTK